MKSSLLRIGLVAACIFAWAIPAYAQLLVTDNFGNQVIRYDAVTGNFVDVLITSQPQDNGGLNGPVGMLIDAHGDLLVASQNTDSILRYNLETGEFLGEFASAKTGNAFAGPAKICIGPDGNIYVANFFGSSVDRVSPDGTGLGPFTNGGPGISGTASFAFGPDGNLYVASFNTGNVQVFDGMTGNFLETLASSLPGATGLLFDDGGDLWVASLFVHTISQLDADGQVLQSFSTGADTFPSNIIFNPNDKSELLIALTGAAGVFGFSSQGLPLGPFASGGGLTVPGQSLVVDSIILGDVNGDGIVSLLDVDPFVEAIATSTFIPEADVNQDGIVNLLDVDPFVDLLSG